MTSLNIFDADKWRDMLRNFDETRAEFLSATSDLLSRRAPTEELERQRLKLIKEARPIKVSMDALLSAMSRVRGWLKQFNFSFGGGNTGLGGQMEALPLIGIGIGLGAVALVISAAAKFIEKFKKYNFLRDQVEAAEKAGASGDAIAKIGRAPKQQRKILGLDSGALPWLFGLAAIVIAGPYIMKQIERRR